MALYTSDRKAIEAASTDEGVHLISKKVIELSGDMVSIDRRKDTILIQTQIYSKVGDNRFGENKHSLGSRIDMLSNTVGISDNQIYVNPISNKDGDSVITELMYFIECELIGILRDKKLKELGI